MEQTPQGQGLCKPATRAVPGLNPAACENTVKESFATFVKIRIALFYRINLFFLSDDIQELYTHEIDECISLILKLLYT